MHAFGIVLHRESEGVCLRVRAVEEVADATLRFEYEGFKHRAFRG